MSGNIIRVNTDSLNRDANTVNDCIGRLNIEIEELVSDFVSLDAMWEGPASEAFRAVYLNDIETLKTLVVKLNEFNSFEYDAREKYDVCEANVSEAVNSIHW